MKKAVRILRDISGATLLEHSLLAALLATTAIIAIDRVGQRATGVFDTVANQVGGSSDAGGGGDPNTAPTWTLADTSFSLTDGVAFTETLAAAFDAEGDDLTYTIDAASSPPAWLTMDQTPELSGIPSGAGSYTATLEVSDGIDTASIDITLNVATAITQFSDNPSPPSGYQSYPDWSDTSGSAATLAYSDGVDVELYGNKSSDYDYVSFAGADINEHYSISVSGDRSGVYVNGSYALYGGVFSGSDVNAGVMGVVPENGSIFLSITQVSDDHGDDPSQATSTAMSSAGGSFSMTTEHDDDLDYVAVSGLDSTATYTVSLSGVFYGYHTAFGYIYGSTTRTGAEIQSGSFYNPSGTNAGDVLTISITD